MMSNIFLLAAALFVSTAALNGNDGVKDYKSLLNPVYAGSPTKTKRSAIGENTYKAYDYRSSNGNIYPLHYVLAPQAGYKTLQERVQKFQILSKIFQRGRNSSDPANGTSVENTKRQNINATEAESSSEDPQPIDPDNSSSDGHINGQYNIYGNNNGTLFPVQYITAPQSGYQTYRGGIPQYQIPYSTFKQEASSLNTILSEDVSSGGKNQRNTNVSEAVNFSGEAEDTNVIEHTVIEHHNRIDSNGAHSTVRHILNPHVGRQLYLQVLPQIQFLSNTMNQHQTSSDSKLQNGTFLGGKKQENTNVSGAINFTEETEDANMSNYAPLELVENKDNNEAYSTSHYILSHNVVHQPYVQMLTPIQFLSNTKDQHQTSPDFKLQNGTSLGGKNQENANVSEAINFSEEIEDTNTSDYAAEELVNKRNNNGPYSTAHYILNPHVVHQPYVQVLPQIQFLSNSMDQHQTSSDFKLHNGTSLGGQNQENTSVSEVISSSEAKTSNGTEGISAGELTNVNSDHYIGNNGAHSTMNYILNPNVIYQPYREVLPPSQIYSNTINQHQTSSNPKSNNASYTPNIEHENTIASEEALKSQQLSQNSNLIAISGNALKEHTHTNAQEENSNNKDSNESKMFEKEVSNTTTEPADFENTSSATSVSFSNEPEQNYHSYADFLTTSLKMYRNEFPLYWIANHPSIGSNDISSSYLASNHLTYPVVPLYYHLVL